MLRRLLDRPISVTMAVLVIVVLGIVSVRTLPVSLIPDTDIPTLTVKVEATGYSAKEMDDAVVGPLRRQLMQIDGLEDITSESRDGSGSIVLTFGQGRDMDFLFIEANEKIDRAMGSLPDISRPKVFKASATDIPAFYLDITLNDGSDDFAGLSRFVSDVISKRMEQLPEVAMADISGTMETQIMVVPDEDRLESLGMTATDLASKIESANVRLGSLSIRDGEYRHNVRFRSFAQSKDEIASIWFTVGGKMMQVKDVAEVAEIPAPRQGKVLSDGKDAISVAVIKQSDARMSALKKSMESLLDQFRAEYPNIDFRMCRDQTRLLEYSINNLVGNIIAGVLLACLVIFLFMRDFKSPALVSLTIPLSLIFSMLIFQLIGLSINIISLSGLILGVGMLTDNTVVLIDNITGKWQRGDDLRTAVLEGTDEVTGAMLSSVLTTCAVFIPLVFLGGTAGVLFRDQAISISVILLTSYMVTITIIPVYYWWWYKGQDRFRPSALLEKFSFDRMERWYEKGAVASIRHYKACVPTLLACLLGTVLVVSQMRKSSLPDITYTDAMATIEWNSSVSMEENAARIEEIGRLISEETENTSALVGVQQYVLGHSGDLSASQASFYLSCGSKRRLEAAKDKMTRHVEETHPEATVAFSNPGNIFEAIFADREAPLVLRLRPTSRPDLDAGLLRKVCDRIREAFPATAEVNTREDVLFMADPELMTLYDISFTDMISAMKTALNGNELFDIIYGDREIPVVMGLGEEDFQQTLQHTFLHKGETDVPLSSLLRQTSDIDLKIIHGGAEGAFYPVPMDMGGKSAKEAMHEAEEIVKADGNFEAGFSGSWFENREMLEQMVFVLLIAIAMLYLILASQFESLVQPLIILSEIVIDIFVSVLVLWVLGVSMNIMSMIGLIVVCGIVINDSILKIDTINRLRRSGLGLDHAVLLAGTRRLKAIVMTSLTTIFSVVPFLSRGNMGADLQYPMSVVIIAGMTVGTLVSLFFVPALYFAIYRGKE